MLLFGRAQLRKDAVPEPASKIDRSERYIRRARPATRVFTAEPLEELHGERTMLGSIEIDVARKIQPEVQAPDSSANVERLCDASKHLRDEVLATEDERRRHVVRRPTPRQLERAANELLRGA
jgi:hypothetical protein